ncbi:MAG: hypothetical protein HYW27_03110 [Candidatus Aenigmarchaeota archaeon]|nr:hypothetical protein [Candidatus Aenigmarchaeota archaeon]
MITVVDNGRGAQEISHLLRAKSTVAKPKDAKEGPFIISDGRWSPESQKIISRLLEKTGKPVMGIGAGMGFLAAFCGAPVKESKAMQKQESVSLKKPSPLLLDFRRVFTVVETGNCVVQELPENFSVHASSKSCEFEVIQDMERPFFGVHFNPELGQDGVRILGNFEKFINVWEKYHKRE